MAFEPNEGSSLIPENIATSIKQTLSKKKGQEIENYS